MQVGQERAAVRRVSYRDAGWVARAVVMVRYSENSRALRRMGFFGRACIHPKQVEVANAVHTPSRGDIEWAQEVVDMSARAEHGALRDRHGAMIDAAVMRRAQRILALAESIT